MQDMGPESDQRLSLKFEFYLLGFVGQSVGQEAPLCRDALGEMQKSLNGPHMKSVLGSEDREASGKRRGARQVSGHSRSHSDILTGLWPTGISSMPRRVSLRRGPRTIKCSCEPSVVLLAGPVYQGETYSSTLLGCCLNTPPRGDFPSLIRVLVRNLQDGLRLA